MKVNQTDIQHAPAASGSEPESSAMGTRILGFVVSVFGLYAHLTNGISLAGLAMALVGRYVLKSVDRGCRNAIWRAGMTCSDIVIVLFIAIVVLLVFIMIFGGMTISAILSYVR